jgi:lipoprotein-anchoring transpeptidase ErfK/SrfK
MQSISMIWRLAVKALFGATLLGVLHSMPAAMAGPSPATTPLIGVPHLTHSGMDMVSVFAEANTDAANVPIFLLGTGGIAAITRVEEQRSDGWLRVSVPSHTAPSSSPTQGWVRPGQLQLQPAKITIEVDLSSHRLTVSQGGRVWRTMAAATGKTETPTPAIATFVVGVRKQVGSVKGPIGPFVLQVAAWSEVLLDYRVDSEWDGIVIQGTNCPKTCIGHSVTNGSIRVTNDNVTWLARHIPAGTPISIY